MSSDPPNASLLRCLIGRQKMKNFQRALLTIAAVAIVSLGGVAASQASVCSGLRAACVYTGWGPRPQEAS